jgi:hypothetical protein
MMIHYSILLLWVASGRLFEGLVRFRQLLP